MDLVVRVLGQYKIEVAALQETKWFGTAVYRVGGSVVLAAGRPTPELDQPKQRGEGVALVLSGSAANLWKEGGEQWRAWSSRLVTARLQVSLQRQRKGRRSSQLHVFSCYAPTFEAKREEKEEFDAS